MRLAKLLNSSSGVCVCGGSADVRFLSLSLSLTHTESNVFLPAIYIFLFFEWTNTILNVTETAYLQNQLRTFFLLGCTVFLSISFNTFSSASFIDTTATTTTTITKLVTHRVDRNGSPRGWGNNCTHTHSYTILDLLTYELNKTIPSGHHFLKIYFYLISFYSLTLIGEYSRSVMVITLVCGLVVSEFEPQSR